MRPVRMPKTPKKTPSKFKAGSVKDPIHVYCRIRPLDNLDEASCIRKKDEKTVVLFQEEPQYAKVGKELVVTEVKVKEVHHTFHEVFAKDTTQKELFDKVAYPLVQDVLNGSDGLLFTYGITSSGKTYTMTGTPFDGGLVPRSLDVIFNSIKDYQAPKFVIKPDTTNGFEVQPVAEAIRDQRRETMESNRTPKPKRRENFSDWSNRVAESTIVDDVSPDMNYSVFVTYVEIYNNFVYDLLEENRNAWSDQKMVRPMVRTDQNSNTYVFGASVVEVKTVEEALELFYKGQKKRRVGSTQLNLESSRSHSVFTIRVVQAPLDNQGAEILQDKDLIIVSQLSLVDLAGSERVSRTRNVGKKVGEAGGINMSLMNLKKCIEDLRNRQRQGNTQEISYRDSKLTWLFKSFFEGEGKIRMIVCVNPGSNNYDELVHIMKFAEMTQDVTVTRPVPVSTPTILGLKPGRGQIYREAFKKAREQGVLVSEVLVPTMYSLGPEFPPLTMDDFEEEASYLNLIDFLNARIIRRNTFTQDLTRKQEDFRKCLVAIDKENIQLKMENARLQDSVKFREQQVRGLEEKVSMDDQTMEVLKGQLFDERAQKEHMKIEVYNKDKRIAEQSVEMERIRTHYKDQLSSEKARLRHLVERRLAAKKAELEQQKCFNQEKLRQVNKILNAGDWDDLGDNGPPSPPSTLTSEVSSTPPRRSKRKSAGDPGETEVKILKARSSTDIVHGRRNTPQSSQPSSSRNDFDYLYAKENKAPSSSQRSLAIANLRHRRSQSSSGDCWVEHKPIGNLELNTVLQPKMKKKKSVTQLNVKDVTNKDSSRYVLQHQEQDSQGEVVTELYKADIIPSAGGGAQVVFNDVETLQQTSPTNGGYNLRKRSNECVPLREIEERCSTSIHCHGLPSKQPKKK